MSIDRYKRLTIALSAVCVGMIVLCGVACWSLFILRLQVDFASEQTSIFEEMRAQASASDPADAVACLAYVVSYYPSGSKQEAGSPLDGLVESARASATRDIIDCLRAKTGEDLGDRPEAWIQKYAKEQKPEGRLGD